MQKDEVIKYYKLDPSNYLTAASLAWDAALLEAKIESDLITSQDILTMIEKTKKFYGWAMAQPLPYKDLKFEEINRRTLETGPETFRTVSEDPDPAPLRTNSETLLSKMLQTPDDAETGYFVEVDLESPPLIHQKLKQFPPCPETLQPEVEWCSDYQRQVMENPSKHH